MRIYFRKTELFLIACCSTITFWPCLSVLVVHQTWFQVNTGWGAILSSSHAASVGSIYYRQLHTASQTLYSSIARPGCTPQLTRVTSHANALLAIGTNLRWRICDVLWIDSHTNNWPIITDHRPVKILRNACIVVMLAVSNLVPHYPSPSSPWYKITTPASCTAANYHSDLVLISVLVDLVPGYQLYTPSEI